MSIDRGTLPTDLLSGAINFDLLKPTATELRVLVYGPRNVPIRSKLRPGEFPIFKVQTFSLMEDHGNVINVWTIRDKVENFHVIGGVSAKVDKREGYIKAYGRIIEEILASEEQSRRAFAVLDHVVTKYLLNR